MLLAQETMEVLVVVDIQLLVKEQLTKGLTEVENGLKVEVEVVPEPQVVLDTEVLVQQYQLQEQALITQVVEVQAKLLAKVEVMVVMAVELMDKMLTGIQ